MPAPLIVATDRIHADAQAMLEGAGRFVVPEQEDRLRHAAWQDGRAVADQGQQISGKTVTIIGVGAIGQRVAAISALGFGMRVLGVHPSRTGTTAPNVTYVALEEGLAKADFLVLSCPLNASTQGLIGAAELAAMQPSAYLINVSRGAVVDSDALCDALHAGRLAGAALDVFATTPLPPGDPLRACPSTRLTPHAAGISAQSLHAMSMGAAAQVLDVLAGRFPPHWVNRDAEAQILARWATLRR